MASRRGKKGTKNGGGGVPSPASSSRLVSCSRIVLWIDPQKWVPIRQQLVEPTEDYLLIDFDNIELNPRLSRSDFEIKLPKDVRVVGG